MFTKISDIAYRFEKLLFGRPSTPNKFYKMFHKPVAYICLPINVIICLVMAVMYILGQKAEEFLDEVCYPYCVFTGVCGYVVVGLIIFVCKFI